MGVRGGRYLVLIAVSTSTAVRVCWWHQPRRGYKGGAMVVIAPPLADFFLKKITKNK